MTTQEDPQAVCRAMIDLLEREHRILQENLQLDIAGLVTEKRALTARLSILDRDIEALSPEQRRAVRTLSAEMARLSERNMAILRGRIDGLQAVIDALRQRESSGVYGPDGTPVSTPDAVRILETA